MFALAELALAIAFFFHIVATRRLVRKRSEPEGLTDVDRFLWFRIELLRLSLGAVTACLLFAYAGARSGQISQPFLAAGGLSAVVVMSVLGYLLVQLWCGQARSASRTNDADSSQRLC